MRKNHISVIIATYNRKKLLEAAVYSVTAQETGGRFSFEIIVIDDGSTDDTNVIIENIQKKSNIAIRYIREEGKGVSNARNQGVLASSGDWIAFFDDDQIADPNWLKELFDFAIDRNLACVGGKRDLQFLVEPSISLSPICRNVLGENNEISMKPEICQRKTMPSTGNAIIRRDTFDIVGGFDETITSGSEDGDFFQRLRLAGIQAWNNPFAVVHHLVPPHRLRENYFLWTSKRWGDWFARRDYRDWGLPKTIAICFARIGHTIIVHIPALAWALITHDEANARGRKCLLSRTVGYVRQTFFLIAPRIFPQKEHFSKFEFRKQNTYFQTDKR